MAAEFYQHNSLAAHMSVSPNTLRPDFVVPVYPVVSMRPPVAHARSRKNLLGHKPSQAYIDSLSLELHVPNNMPPTLLIATQDDPVVNPQNSIMLDSALTANNIKHTFAFYEKGGHGFGYKPNNSQAPEWHTLLIEWIEKHVKATK